RLFPQHAAHVGGVEVLASRRAGQRPAVERVAQQRREGRGVDGAGPGEGGADVGGPAGGGGDGGIQQGVARPEVAGEHLVAREQADQAQVGDPADVQHRGATSLVGAQQQLVQQRGQRGPVAAGGDVGTAQVVEDGHAGGRGETARVPDLQGAEDVAVPDLVVEGLAVGGDQVGAAVGGQDPSGRGRE